MTKVLYTLIASCRNQSQYFAVSQSKVPHLDLMLLITSGITTSPQNRFLYSCELYWCNREILNNVIKIDIWTVRILGAPILFLPNCIRNIKQMY